MSSTIPSIRHYYLRSSIRVDARVMGYYTGGRCGFNSLILDYSDDSEINHNQL